MNRRKQIIQIIEAEGPADLKHLHDRLGGNLGGVQQLLVRMVKDGQLANFPLAPRTYFTKTSASDTETA